RIGWPFRSRSRFPSLSPNRKCRRPSSPLYAPLSIRSPWLAGWLASRNGAVEPIFAHPPAHESELRAPTSLRGRARNVQFRAQLRRSAQNQRAGRPRRTRNAAGASPWGFESLRLRCCNTSTYGAGPGAVLVPANRLVSRMVSRPPDRRAHLAERAQHVVHRPRHDRVAAGRDLASETWRQARARRRPPAAGALTRRHPGPARAPAPPPATFQPARGCAAGAGAPPPPGRAPPTRSRAAATRSWPPAAISSAIHAA